MKSGKFPPVVVALLAVMVALIAGLVFFLVSDGFAILSQPPMLLALCAMITMGLIGVVTVSNTRRQLHEQAAQNERNQAAILQLLDELADLADGDLRVHASVTENFTGAIADSINFAIDQMRGLVAKINHLSVQVAKAAGDTQNTAGELTEAAEHQARQIGAASAAINDMAASIDHVSSNATESASVAERAVAIANKGSGVVQDTIGGMDSIRGQIQETAKRIKRLGESSQEIGPALCDTLFARLAVCLRELCDEIQRQQALD